MTRKLDQPLCPRDGSELEARSWHDAEYGFCPTCHGIRIEGAELDELLRSGGGPPVSHPEDGSEPERIVEGTALCSCSGQPLMAHVVLEALSLDVCQACGAFWFDAGEMQCFVAARRYPEVPDAASWFLGSLATLGYEVVTGTLVEEPEDPGVVLRRLVDEAVGRTGDRSPGPVRSLPPRRDA